MHPYRIFLFHPVTVRRKNNFMKKFSIYLVLICSLFSSVNGQSSFKFLFDIQSKDFHTGIFFGLNYDIYSVPIVSNPGYQYIKSKLVYELNSFDEFIDSGDQPLETTYSFNEGILKEKYGYHATTNKKMVYKKCEWTGSNKIECHEKNFLIRDDKDEFNIKEIYLIEPSNKKITIQRFIKLGLIEEITLLFNSDNQLKSIKKEKFNDTVETYDEEESQKYLAVTFGDELVKINFNRSYFNDELKSISERKAFYKDGRLKDSGRFENFKIDGNLISNFLGMFEWEEADIKMGGSGMEIEFVDSTSKSKLNRTSSYLGYKSKGRSTTYYSFFR